MDDWKAYSPPIKPDPDRARLVRMAFLNEEKASVARGRVLKTFYAAIATVIFLFLVQQSGISSTAIYTVLVLIGSIAFWAVIIFGIQVVWYRSR